MKAIQNEEFDSGSISALVVSILASAVVTHYLLQLWILLLGGKPNFEDLDSLLVNGSVLAVCLTIGWLTRRVLLVAAVFTVLGLAFLGPYFFILKGPLNLWLIQLSTYLLPFLFSGVLFVAISKATGIPERPRRKRDASLC